MIVYELVSRRGDGTRDLPAVRVLEEGGLGCVGAERSSDSPPQSLRTNLKHHEPISAARGFLAATVTQRLPSRVRMSVKPARFA